MSNGKINHLPTIAQQKISGISETQAKKRQRKEHTDEDYYDDAFIKEQQQILQDAKQKKERKTSTTTTSTTTTTTTTSPSQLMLQQKNMPQSVPAFVESKAPNHMNVNIIGAQISEAILNTRRDDQGSKFLYQRSRNQRKTKKTMEVQLSSSQNNRETLHNELVNYVNGIAYLLNNRAPENPTPNEAMNKKLAKSEKANKALENILTSLKYSYSELNKIYTEQNLDQQPQPQIQTIPVYQNVFTQPTVFYSPNTTQVINSSMLPAGEEQIAQGSLYAYQAPTQVYNNTQGSANYSIDSSRLADLTNSTQSDTGCENGAMPTNNAENPPQSNIRVNTSDNDGGQVQLPPISSMGAYTDEYFHRNKQEFKNFTELATASSRPYEQQREALGLAPISFLLNSTGSNDQKQR